MGVSRGLWVTVFVADAVAEGGDPGCGVVIVETDGTRGGGERCGGGEGVSTKLGGIYANDSGAENETVGGSSSSSSSSLAAYDMEVWPGTNS